MCLMCLGSTALWIPDQVWNDEREANPDQVWNDVKPSNEHVIQQERHPKLDLGSRAVALGWMRARCALGALTPGFQIKSGMTSVKLIQIKSGMTLSGLDAQV